ncbi:MAG: hypothetical protein HS107_08450 [Thermoflexaceae bacterium]|nr:hypothetical protein [Thermoflexaceae bacterium]
MGELEDALARTERDAELAAGTAARLLRLLKRAQSAASSGDLGTMERAFSDADQALAEARERLREGAGLDNVRVAEEVRAVGRAEDGDVRLERPGGLAFTQDLEVSRAARNAQAFGLPLDPHRLPLPRPNKSGRNFRSGPRGAPA